MSKNIVKVQLENLAALKSAESSKSKYHSPRDSFRETPGVTGGVKKRDRYSMRKKLVKNTVSKFEFAAIVLAVVQCTLCAHCVLRY
jgi:hypothetical protein